VSQFFQALAKKNAIVHRRKVILDMQFRAALVHFSTL
jgi:hypothetical protein